MLKSALDYFGGTNASNPVDHGSNINAIDDPLVGSVVDVGGVKVAVKRRWIFLRIISQKILHHYNYSALEFQSFQPHL